MLRSKLFQSFHKYPDHSVSFPDSFALLQGLQLLQVSLSLWCSTVFSILWQSLGICLTFNFPISSLLWLELTCLHKTRFWPLQFKKLASLSEAKFISCCSSMAEGEISWIGTPTWSLARKQFVIKIIKKVPNYFTLGEALNMLTAFSVEE